MRINSCLVGFFFYSTEVNVTAVLTYILEMYIKMCIYFIFEYNVDSVSVMEYSGRLYCHLQGPQVFCSF